MRDELWVMGKTATQQLLTHHLSLVTDHCIPSGFYGFRPHLQRRDREGLAPSSLAQESQCGGHSRRPGRRLSSSLMAVAPSSAHVLTGMC